MTELLQFEDLVKKKFNGLSAGQKKVAEYILQHLEKASYDTIAKISRDTEVSETTVIRLSYALGFNSFSEMQKGIRKQILDQNQLAAQQDAGEAIGTGNPYAKIIEQDIHILKQTLAQLDLDHMDKVIDHLIQADTVHVVGGRSSYAAASWFAMMLGNLRDNVKLISSNGDVLEGLANLTNQSVVVAISFPRYARETHKYAKTAQAQGATLISVTDNKLSPIGCISSYTLLTNTNKDETGLNSIAPVVSLLNLVVVGMRMKDHTRIMSRLQKLEELYSAYDILFE